VEKGFLRTAIGQELVDPKTLTNLAQTGRAGRRRPPGGPLGGRSRVDVVPTQLVPVSKGNRVNIPEPGSARLRGDATDLGDVVRCSKESSLFSLTSWDDPGIVSYGERAGPPEERPNLRGVWNAAAAP